MSRIHRDLCCFAIVEGRLAGDSVVREFREGMVLVLDLSQ